MNNNQVVFPTQEILSDIEQQSIMKLTKLNAIMIIAACIYYLDKSEMLAWIESFMGNLSGLHTLNRFSDTDKSHLYENCETYILYKSLYSLLMLHKNTLSEIIRSDNFLNEYV